MEPPLAWWKSESQGPSIFPTITLPFFTLLFLFLFLFPRSGFAADVTLAWDPNTESDLEGYRIYYKTGSSGAPYNGTGALEGDSPIDVPLALLIDEDNPEYTLTGLSDSETYYFVVTAYNIDTQESSYSNEASTGSGSGVSGGGGCFIATVSNQ